MASESPSFLEDENPQKQEPTSHSSSFSESLSGRSSGYGGSFDIPEDSVFGDVKRRPHHCNCRKGEDSRQAPLTEADVTEIYENIGRDWKRLGRKLKFLEAKLESISDDKSNHNYEEKAHALLIKFIQEQGSDATKGRLAEALISINRRDLAEHLIGSKHFVSKDQQFFFLKDEGSLNVPGEDGKPKEFFACRNIENGRLYLIRELVGTGYEESCEVLKREDTIADSILKALDVNGIVKAEKQKKERQKFNEAQAKIVKLLKGLQEIMDSLENQEKTQKRIQVWEQVLEDEELLLGKMQRLGTELLNLTSPVSRLQDPFPLEAQMYSFSLGLSALHRDLEERVKMLKEMAPRGKKLLDKIATEKFEQLLKRSRNVGKQIKMAENGFVKRLKEAASTLENQQRPRHGEDSSSSDPPPKTSRYQVDVPEIRRGHSQPGSERERRTLQEEVAPPPDPIEQDEESHC